MYHPSESPQALRSQTLITDALFELMKHESIRDISVTQICQQAHVARQTFYRNYRTKEEVIERHLRRLWIDHYTECPPSFDDMEYDISELYEHLPISRNMLQAIADANLYLVLYSSIHDALLRSSSRGKLDPMLGDARHNRYLYCFIASTICATLSLWTVSGFRETTDELARMNILFFAGTGARWASEFSEDHGPV